MAERPFVAVGPIALLVAALVVGGCGERRAQDEAAAIASPTIDGVRSGSVVDAAITADSSPPPSPTTTGNPAAEVIAPRLTATEWVLVSIDGEPLPGHMTVTLRFLRSDSGWISGEVVCNFYSLNVTVAAYGDIAFDEGGAVTDMACETESLTLEQLSDLTNRYIATLNDVSNYRIDGDQLRLETDDGRGLTFQRSH